MPESRKTARRLHGLLRFADQVFEEPVDERHVAQAVHAHGVALVLHLSDVARRAVEADHLSAFQLSAAERYAHRQTVRIADALRVRQQAVPLDVLEKWPYLKSPIARRRFDFEREQPVHRIELASFGQ